MKLFSHAPNDSVSGDPSSRRAPAPPVNPHVVVLGGGFGGLEFCRRMKNAPVRITLIDRQNHHLFQPLLYQVASAGLSAPDIASPFRGMLAKQDNVSVLMEDILGVDPGGRCVITSKRTMTYDYLVVALGAKTSFFGHDDWREHTLDLKSLDDAVAMRRVVLSAFEEAEGCNDPDEVRRLTTIAVVGGGPTGVELAGSFAELSREVLPGNFRRINPAEAQILLVEGGPRLLPAYAAGQSEYTRRRLEKMGVTVKTDCLVSEVGDGFFVAGGERIEASAIVWAAGVEAPSMTRSMGIPVDKAGRLKVEPDLSLPSFPEAFAVGDIAHVTDANGRAVPGVAPAAMQMGKHVAAIIRAEERRNGRSPQGRPSRPPFRYRDKGSMATIGRSSAVASIGNLRFNGIVAWFAWLFIHLAFLVGVKNRLFVFLQWIYAYATYRRGARVITGVDQPARVSGLRPPRKPSPRANLRHLSEPNDSATFTQPLTQ